MGNRTVTYLAAFLLVLFLFAAGCSDENTFVTGAGAPPANNCPQILETLPSELSPAVVVGDTIHFSVNASDPDGDTLTCMFSVDDVVMVENACFDYIAQQPGTLRVHAVVSDGELEADHEWVPRVSPPAVNRAPEITGAVPAERTPETYVGERVQFSVAAFDPDGDELTYEFTVADSVVSNASHYDYTAESAGSFGVRVVASDGQLEVAKEWMLTVIDPLENHPPSLLRTVPKKTTPEIEIGHVVTFSVDAADPDGDELSYSFVVNNTVVSRLQSYSYLAERLGTEGVRVLVTDGEFAVEHMWLLTVLEDQTPPSTVSVVDVEPGGLPYEVEVRWLAVGDDGNDGRASRYLIGVSDSPIDSELDWNNAAIVNIDGSGHDPGTEMSRIVVRGGAGQVTAVTIRAVDEMGNMSALGASVTGYTRGFQYKGEVRDIVTGAPVVGAAVRNGDIVVFTDYSGQWIMQDVPYPTAGLSVSDDNVAGPVGEYYDYRIGGAYETGSQYTVQLIPQYTMLSTIHPDHLVFLYALTVPLWWPYPSYLRHWNLPIDIYVPPFEANGLDYKATIERVVTDLTADIGFQVFNVVDSLPDVGIDCRFVPDLQRDNYGTHEWSEDWYPVKGNVEFRTTYTPQYLRAFERVIRHELGHALGLRHSQDKRHLMVGGMIAPQVDTFTPDEVNVLEFIYGCKVTEVLDFSSYVHD